LNINQALRKLAALKGEHTRITKRLQDSNILVWKKDLEPSFNFEELIGEYNRVSTEIIELKSNIAKTNAHTLIRHGDLLISLAEAVITLQEVKGFIKFYEVLEELAPEHKVYTVAENSYVSGQVNTLRVEMNAATTKKQCVLAQDVCREQFNSLNAAVEAANHSTELLSRG
jgi:hypothetical protein